MNVTVFGRGRVGRGLAGAWQRAGLEARLVPGREGQAADVAGAEVIVLAVPDGAIAGCAARIAPGLERASCVLHCAGARGVDELATCGAAGGHVGVMHPLVSFADGAQPPCLAGTTFTIAGDAYAVTAAEALVHALGARPLMAALHGAAYHAVAALVANGTVGLVHAAVPVLEQLGLTRSQAEHAVAGLLRTVADNVRELGVPRALTGPIMRGDAATVAAHRDALRGIDADTAAAYDAVVPAVLRCAQAAGLSRESAEAVAETLCSQESLFPKKY